MCSVQELFTIEAGALVSELVKYDHSLLRRSIGCEVLQVGLQAKALGGVKLGLLGVLRFPCPLAVGKFETQHNWTDTSSLCIAGQSQQCFVIQSVVPVRSQPPLYTGNFQLFPSAAHPMSCCVWFGGGPALSIIRALSVGM